MNIKEVEEIIKDSKLSDLESVKSLLGNVDKMLPDDKEVFLSMKMSLETLLNCKAKELIDAKKNLRNIINEFLEAHGNNYNEEIEESLFKINQALHDLILTRITTRETLELFKALFPDEK